MKLYTRGFNGCAIQHSPFDRRLAVASSQNFGLVGNGRLWIIDQGIIKTFDTNDALFDLAFSENHENQLAVACGDGSVKLFDLTLDDYPVASWMEHSREVMSVNWNVCSRDCFVTASWDGSIKLFYPNRLKSLCTWRAHDKCVYRAVWSPRENHIFASCGGDGLIKLWDVRMPNSISSFQGHDSEILALDFNKYNNTIVSGGVDSLVKVWDLRNFGNVAIHRGHRLAVRSLKCSPHSENVIASTSYDMTCRVWNTNIVHEAHSEFVTGVDFSLFVPGQIATCAWDESIHIFNI